MNRPQSPFMLFPGILLSLSTCDTTTDGADDDGVYELVYEDPEHHQIWWPEINNARDMPAFERQVNEYPRTGCSITGHRPPSPQHYCLCVIMTLEEVTGETRLLKNKSSRYNDWVPRFSAGENYVYFVRQVEFADPHTFRFCRVPVAGGEADVEPLSDPSIDILWHDLFSNG